MHCDVEVGGSDDVEMHAPVTFAPAASRTTPVMVIACLVAEGDGVALRVGSGVAGRNDSVRSGVGVGTTVGETAFVGVTDGGGGSSWTAGEPEEEGARDGDGEVAADGVGDAERTGVAVGTTTVVSIRGIEPSSWVTAADAAVRALAAAAGWPAAS